MTNVEKVPEEKFVSVIIKHCSIIQHAYNRTTGKLPVVMETGCVIHFVLSLTRKDFIYTKHATYDYRFNLHCRKFGK